MILHQALYLISIFIITLGCPKGYVGRTYVNKRGIPQTTCFRYFLEVKTWAEARIWCKQDGGVVAAVSSEEEALFVSNLIVPSRGAPWVGAYYTGGRWKWLDDTVPLAQNGSDFSINQYTPWRKYHPSVNSGCAQLSPVSTPKYTKMHARPCGSYSFFVCQAPPLPPIGMFFSGDQPQTTKLRQYTNITTVILDMRNAPAMGMDRSIANIEIFEIIETKAASPTPSPTGIVTVQVNNTSNETFIKSDGIRHTGGYPQSGFDNSQKKIEIRCIRVGLYKMRLSVVLQNEFIPTPSFIEARLLCLNNTEVELFGQSATTTHRASEVCLDEEATQAKLDAYDVVTAAPGGNSTPAPVPNFDVWKLCKTLHSNVYWSTPPSGVVGPPDYFDIDMQQWYSSSCVPYKNDSTTWSPESTSSSNITILFSEALYIKEVHVYIPNGIHFVKSVGVITLTEEGKFTQSQTRNSITPSPSSTKAVDIVFESGEVVSDEIKRFSERCAEACNVLRVSSQTSTQVPQCVGWCISNIAERCKLYSLVTKLSPVSESNLYCGSYSDGSGSYTAYKEITIDGQYINSNAILYTPDGSVELPEHVTVDAEVTSFYKINKNFINGNSQNNDTAVPTWNETRINATESITRSVSFSHEYLNSNTTGVQINKSNIACVELPGIELVPTTTDIPTATDCLLVYHHYHTTWEHCKAATTLSGGTYSMIAEIGNSVFEIDSSQNRILSSGLCKGFTGNCYNRKANTKTRSGRVKCPTECEHKNSISLITNRACIGSSFSTDHFDHCLDIASSRYADSYSFDASTSSCVVLSGTCPVESKQALTISGRLRCGRDLLESVLSSDVTVAVSDEIWKSTSLDQTSFFPQACPSRLRIIMTPQQSVRLSLVRQVVVTVSYPPTSVINLDAGPSLGQMDAAGLIGIQQDLLWESEMAVYLKKFSIRVTGVGLLPGTDQYAILNDPVGGRAKQEQIRACSALKSPQQYVTEGNADAFFIHIYGGELGNAERPMWYTLCIGLRGMTPFIPIYSSIDNNLIINPPPVRIQWRDNESPSPIVIVGVPVVLSVQQVDIRNGLISLKNETILHVVATSMDTQEDLSFEIKNITEFINGYATLTLAFHTPTATLLSISGSWKFHDIVIDNAAAEAVIRVSVGSPHHIAFSDVPQAVTTILKVTVVIEVKDVQNNTVASDFSTKARLTVPRMLANDGGLVTAQSGVLTFIIVFAATGKATLSVLPTFEIPVDPTLPQFISTTIVVGPYDGPAYMSPGVLQISWGSELSQNQFVKRTFAQDLSILLNVQLRGVSVIKISKTTSLLDFVTDVIIPVGAVPVVYRQQTSRLINTQLTEGDWFTTKYQIKVISYSVFQEQTATDPPTVMLIPPNQRGGSSSQIKISSAKKLILRSNVSHPAPHITIWDSDLNLTKLEDNGNILTGISHPDLVIDSNTLCSGAVHYFSVTGIDKATASRVACGAPVSGISFTETPSCKTMNFRVQYSLDNCISAASLSGADFVVYNSRSGSCVVFTGNDCATAIPSADQFFTTHVPLCGRSLLQSTASVSLVVNAPPFQRTQSLLDVSPKFGIALETSFYINACPSNWDDEPSDLPLKYVFTYTKIGNLAPGDSRSVGEVYFSGLSDTVGNCSLDLEFQSIGVDDCVDTSLASSTADYYEFEKSSLLCRLYSGICIPLNPCTSTCNCDATDSTIVNVNTNGNETSKSDSDEDGFLVEIESGKLTGRPVVIRSYSHCYANTTLPEGVFAIMVCAHDQWDSPGCYTDPVVVTIEMPAEPNLDVLDNAINSAAGDADPQVALASVHVLADYINKIPENETSRGDLKKKVLGAVKNANPVERPELIAETCQSVSALSSNPRDLDASMRQDTALLLSASLNAAAAASTSETTEITIDTDTGIAALEGFSSILVSDNFPVEVNVSSIQDEPKTLLSRIFSILQSDNDNNTNETESSSQVSLEDRERAATIDNALSTTMGSLKTGLLSKAVPGERATIVKTTGLAMAVQRTVGPPSSLQSGSSSITIPTTLSQEVPGADGNVDSQLTEVSQDTKAKLSSGDESESPIVGFSLGNLRIQGLTEPLRITMYGKSTTKTTSDPTNTLNTKTTSCRWWNENLQQWSGEGCHIVVDGVLYRCGTLRNGQPMWCRRQPGNHQINVKPPAVAQNVPTIQNRRRQGRILDSSPTQYTSLRELVCECDHATEFSVGGLSDLKPKPNLPNFDLTDLSNISLLVLVIVVSFSGCAVLSVTILCIRDYNLPPVGSEACADLTLTYGELLKSSGRKHSKQMTAVPNAGKKTVSEQTFVTCECLQRPWVVDLSDSTNSKLKNFIKLYLRICTSSHIWIRALVKQVTSTSNFELHQKILVLWCLIAAALFVNAVWYQHPKPGETQTLIARMANNTYAAASTIAVLLPSAFALSHFFVYTPPLSTATVGEAYTLAPDVIQQNDDDDNMNTARDQLRDEIEMSDVIKQKMNFDNKSKRNGYLLYEITTEQMNAIIEEEVRLERLHSAVTMMLLHDNILDLRDPDVELGPSLVQTAIDKVRTIYCGVQKKKFPTQTFTKEVVRNDCMHTISVVDLDTNYDLALKEESLRSRWLPPHRCLYSSRATGLVGRLHALPQFQLASVLFQVSLLGENADLFTLIHRIDASELTVRETISHIINNNRVGRSWASYYARKHLKIHASSFATMHALSLEVLPKEIEMIYGLRNPLDPVFMGGVGYISDVEIRVLEHNESYHWHEGVAEVANACSGKGSFVKAAHIFRHAILSEEDIKAGARKMAQLEEDMKDTNWTDGNIDEPDSKRGSLWGSECSDEDIQNRMISVRQAVAFETNDGEVIPTLTDETGLSILLKFRSSDPDALKKLLIETMTGVLISDGDPLNEGTRTRGIEYGRVVARHYALLAGFTAAKFCNAYLDEQDLEMAKILPGRITIGTIIEVSDNEERVRECCGKEWNDLKLHYLGQQGKVTRVYKEGEYGSGKWLRILFGDRQERIFPPGCLQTVGGVERDEVLTNIVCGQVHKISSYDKAIFHVNTTQTGTNLFVPRRVNMHLTYALNSLDLADLKWADQFPNRMISSGILYVSSPLNRRGCYASPFHSLTRRGQASLGLTKGLGTRVNPFVGLEAAVTFARAGDTLVMLPGIFPPTVLQDVRGRDTNPLKIISLDHHQALRQLDVPCEDFKLQFHFEELDLVSQENQVARKQAIDDCPAPPAVIDGEIPLTEAAVPKPLQSSETSAENELSQMYTTKFSNLLESEIDSNCVFKMRCCRNIVVLGIHFTKGSVAFDSRDAEIIAVVGCLVDNVKYPILQSAVDRRLQISGQNTITSLSDSIAIARFYHIQDYALKWVLVGYGSCVVYLGFNLILIILMTVSFDDDKTNGWLQATVASLAVDILLTRPAMSLLKCVWKLLILGSHAVIGSIGGIETVRNDF